MTRITDTLNEDQYTILIIFCSVLLKMRNDSHRTFRENWKDILRFTFFRKLYRLLDNVEKYCKTEQTTNDNMTQCMLDT